MKKTGREANGLTGNKSHQVHFQNHKEKFQMKHITSIAVLVLILFTGTAWSSTGDDPTKTNDIQLLSMNPLPVTVKL